MTQVAADTKANYVSDWISLRMGRHINQPEIAMESPCVKICVIDEARGICTGCGRSRREIAQWTSYTDSQRRQIMNELPRRLALQD